MGIYILAITQKNRRANENWELSDLAYLLQPLSIYSILPTSQQSFLKIIVNTLYLLYHTLFYTNIHISDKFKSLVAISPEWFAQTREEKRIKQFRYFVPTFFFSVYTVLTQFPLLLLQNAFYFYTHKYLWKISLLVYFSQR